MKTFDLLDIAVSGRERRQEQADANLWALIKAGNVAAINKQLHEPERALCDDCQERPGTNQLKSAGTDTLLCEVCIEDDRRQRNRLPRFRNRDERDAWMAGSRTHGEI